MKKALVLKIIIAIISGEIAFSPTQAVKAQNMESKVEINKSYETDKNLFTPVVTETGTKAGFTENGAELSDEFWIKPKH